MATLTIRGVPLISFTFPHLPSWNDAIQAARGRAGHYTAAHHTKQWRRYGEAMARYVLKDTLGYYGYLLQTQALVVVKVYRATQRVYDVHNVYTKAIFDGFTDAGIWRGDDYKHVPWVVYGYIPMDKLESALMGQCFVVEIYELEGVIFDRDEKPTESLWEVFA